MRERGFTYIALLIAIALMGAGLGLAGSIWSTDAKRERELDLLFAGDQIRHAIMSYHDESPAGQPSRFPAKLDDLVQDRRWPVTKRHLRKIFIDPMTNSHEWQLVRAPDNTIMGVNSSSEAEPLKRSGFPDDYANFSGAKTYRDWQFVYSQPQGSNNSQQPGTPKPATPAPPPQTQH